jgi:hypothetical protein
MPATDLNSYFSSLNLLAIGNASEELQRTRDATLLYFIFHFLLQWPYPYDKPSQISAVPPKDLVNEPFLRQYVETLDILAMTLEEYKNSLSNLMAVDQIAKRWGWGVSLRSEGFNT